MVLDSYLDNTYCDSNKDSSMYAVTYTNTVQLNFAIGPKNLTGDDIVGILPEKFRPPFLICLPVSARDGSGEWKSGNFYPTFLRIDRNGEIHLITGTNAAKIKYINGLITYFK